MDNLRHTVLRLLKLFARLSRAALGLIANVILRTEARWAMQKERVVIYDEQVPFVLSPFRESEYSELISTIQDAVLVAHSSKGLGDPIGRWRTVRALLNRAPRLRGRIIHVDSSVRLKSRLVYTVFLNAAYSLATKCAGVPFVFVLYPGGGFQLNDPESDRKLSIVLESPSFRGVMATQPATLAYLRQKGVSEHLLFYSYGVLIDIPEKNLRHARMEKNSRPRIIFCAFKYTHGGLDKGFDVFIDTIAELEERGIGLDAHIVGNFLPSDINRPGVDSNQISWHGALVTRQLEALLKTCDIIISPNRADTLAKGAFDGFPTASVMLAGLCGVLMICTDPLDQGNEILVDGVHYRRIEPSTVSSTQCVEDALRNWEVSARIAAAGAERLRELLSVPDQLTRRLEMVAKGCDQENRILN